MDKQKVVGIRLDESVILEVRKLSDATGVKASDIYRMALTKAVNDIKESGTLPIPTIQADA